MSDVSSSLYSIYQAAQWGLFVDLLFTDLDYFPEETFMLVSLKYEAPSRFDFRNVIDILLQFLAVE